MNSPTSNDAAEPARELLVHADFLRALARRLVADPGEADDVVQEVWLRTLHRPPAASSSLRAWLARISRKRFSDRRRSAGLRAQLERASALELDARRGEGGVAQRVAALDELGRALAALPESYRHVLYLRYYEDRNPEGIAEQLGRPLATVKTQLRRGLELLRADMQRRAGGEGRLGSWLLPLAAGVGLSRTQGASALLNGAFMMKKTLLAAALVLVAVGSYMGFELEGVLGVESELPALDDGGLALERLGRVVPTEERAPVPADATPARGGRAAAAATAPLFGTVRYSGHGDGVPFFRFTAEAGGTRETITTDALGNYRSARAFPEQVSLHLLHEPAREVEAEETRSRGRGTPLEPLEAAGSIVPTEMLTSFAFTGRSAPTETLEQRELARATLDGHCDFEVQLGPTFFIELSFPPGYRAEDLIAIYSPPEAELERHAIRRAAVSGAAELWVRFARNEELHSEQPGWRLGLETSDGRWAGAARVPFTAEVCAEPVRIELEEYATLEGQLETGAGAPPRDLWVQLQSGELDVHRMVKPGEDGRYAFRLLESGVYTLFVTHTDFYPWETTQRVQVGAQHVTDIQLDARPPGGSLAGRITSSTGQFRGRVVLFLEGLDDQDVWRRADPSWVEQDGGFVADYRFDELGSGSYRVSCCTVDALVVEERVRTLRPPNEAAHFHVDDARELSSLQLRALDEVTGEPIEAFQVYFHPRGNVEALERGTTAAPWRREVSAGVEFLWRLHAPGYRSATGDERDFGASDELEVRLSKGFSAVINLNSIESLRSLPQVEVFADGVAVGWTDEDGFLHVDLEERPQRITVDPTLWTVYDDDSYHSDFDVDEGFDDWDSSEVFLSAYLRPVR